jgi:hypothetical protein
MGKYVKLTQVFSIVLISLLIGVTAMSCQLPSVPGPVNPGGPTPLPDSNADLSAISISSGSLVPAFDRGIHTYSVMVPFEYFPDQRHRNSRCVKQQRRRRLGQRPRSELRG